MNLHDTLGAGHLPERVGGNRLTGGGP
jgi:hypothetical protein